MFKIVLRRSKTITHKWGKKTHTHTSVGREGNDRVINNEGGHSGVGCRTNITC